MNFYEVRANHGTEFVIQALIEAAGYSINTDGHLSFYSGNETIATFSDWSGVVKIEDKITARRRPRITSEDHA